MKWLRLKCRLFVIDSKPVSGVRNIYCRKHVHVMWTLFTPLLNEPRRETKRHWDFQTGPLKTGREILDLASLGILHLCCENKESDQLYGYRIADLRL